MFNHNVLLVIAHLTLRVCVYCLDKAAPGTSDVSFHRAPFPLFELRFIKYFTRTSIKWGQGATLWGFSENFIQTHTHTHAKPFTAHTSKISDKHHHNHRKSHEISLFLVQTHTPDAHSVSAELASARAGLKIPPSVLLGLAWGRTGARAYKCPLCSAVEMSNKWLFY